MVRHLAFALALAVAAEARARACPGFVVAIDAGHSDARPGATSARGRTERSFNIRLVNELAAALEKAGIRTRRLAPEDDLAARAAAAAGASVMVSIHHDSVQERFLESWTFEGRSLRRTRHAAGHSVFVSRRNGMFGASLRHASAIARRLLERGLAPSRHHSEPIEGENRPLLDAKAGLSAFDGLKVLRTAPVPALLVEAAVIASDEDEVRADDPAYRAELVAAIVEGLLGSCAAPAAH